MLGLATHEPHFTIIREQVIDHAARKCHICGQLGHLAADCQGAAKKKSGAFDELGAMGAKIGPQRPFQFLHLNILR
jgi:5'-3' exoribonuclease 2